MYSGSSMHHMVIPKKYVYGSTNRQQYPELQGKFGRPAGNITCLWKTPAGDFSNYPIWQENSTCWVLDIAGCLRVLSKNSV